MQVSAFSLLGIPRDRLGTLASLVGARIREEHTNSDLRTRCIAILSEVFIAVVPPVLGHLVTTRHKDQRVYHGNLFPAHTNSAKYKHMTDVERQFCEQTIPVFRLSSSRLSLLDLIYSSFIGEHDLTENE